MAKGYKIEIAEKRRVVRLHCLVSQRFGGSKPYYSLPINYTFVGTRDIVSSHKLLVTFLA